MPTKYIQLSWLSNAILGIITSMGICYHTSCYADCIFVVTNYANVAVTAEAGFYGDNASKQTFKVGNASSNSIKIKSDYTCNSTSPAGLGVAYINLKGGKSQGGWVFSPASAMLRAVGTSWLDKDSVKGSAPDGTSLILNHNYKPSPDKFAVVIEQAGRNLSKPASMN